MKVVVVIFAVALVAATTAGEAISCGQVDGFLDPCLGYLTGEGEPPASCCGGVRSVADSLQSRQDRQTACYCMKSAASSYGVRADSASNLPGKCGVSIGITVTPYIDCSQYVSISRL